MKVLHIDVNHPSLIEQFEALGFENHEDYTSTKSEIEQKIHEYDGLVLRSRFAIDADFIDKAVQLKFIGRLGAGLENINTRYAKKRNIFLAPAPEGNRNAVAEHNLGMLLSLFNKLNKADKEVRSGKWDREGNRGIELDGKTVGLIGYGNMGKAFAKKLQGFDVEILCYDIQGGVGDENARQVGILELQQRSDIISLHIPETELALRSKKILGAGLDVLEYEKSSFENMFTDNDLPAAFKYLTTAENVILSPHVAGWTVESYQKLAQTVVDKVKEKFC